MSIDVMVERSMPNTPSNVTTAFAETLEQRKPRSVQEYVQSSGFDGNWNSGHLRSESDLDDILTKAIGGNSFSTARSSISSAPQLASLNSEAACCSHEGPVSFRGSDSSISTMQQLQQQQQQRFSSRSTKLRISRSRARRARRNDRGSSSSFGSSRSSFVSEAPPADRNGLGRATMRQEGGSIVLTPDSEREDAGIQRVGDALVGTIVTSRTRDSVASALSSRDFSSVGSTSGAQQQAPPEYRIEAAEKQIPQNMPPGDKCRPGAFAVPQRAFGGVPAWFEEALRRRRQQQQQQQQLIETGQMLARCGSSGCSSSSGGSFASAHSALHVSAQLHDSNRANADWFQEGEEEDSSPNERGLGNPQDLLGLRRCSSVPDANCSAIVAEICKNLDDGEDAIAIAKIGKVKSETKLFSRATTKAPSPLLATMMNLRNPITRLRKKKVPPSNP